METRTWETLELFDGPVRSSGIHLVGSPLEVPGGVEDVVRKKWDSQLRTKQEELARLGMHTEIMPYGSTGLNALFENNTQKMWPGPAVTLMETTHDMSDVKLFVGQTSFPFIAVLKDPVISALYESQGIKKPRPALAICTFVKTGDGYLTMTVRGPKASMYPGRLYAPGGNPEYPHTNIIKHQQDEIADEIRIWPGEYDPDKMVFAGLVADNEQLPGKPDLVGWVPVDIESGDIQARAYGRPLSKRPNDVIGVAFAPAQEGHLFDYLTKETHPLQYCPPAHGGLVLYGRHSFGKEWADEVIKRLE